MKQKYVKPVVRKVKLVPSEAVLQACKTYGYVGGPTITNCQMAVAAQFCSAWGS